MAATLGPQSARRLQGRGVGGGEIEPPSRDGLLIGGAAAAAAPQLPDDVRLLKERNTALEEQLWRANKELQHYQSRYGPSERDADVGKVPDEMPPWLSEPGMMSPLLKAYDGRIAELREAFERREQDFRTLSDQMETILAENEELRSAQRRHVEGILGSGGDGVGAAGVGLGRAEEAAELNERLDTLFAENSVLVQQNNVLKEEASRLQAYCDARNAEMSKLTEVMQEAGESVSRSEARIKDLEGAKAACEAEALEKATLLASAEESLASARSAFQTAEGANAKLVKQVADYKAALLEKSRLLDSEREGLTAKVHSGAERIHELQGLLGAKTEDCDALQKRLRDATRELETVRADAEGMVQVLSGLERQIEDFAAKEASLTAAKRDCSRRVDDALLERDRAVALERQSREELRRVRDRRAALREERAREGASEASEARRRLGQLLASREKEFRDLLGELSAAKQRLDLAKEAQRAAERKYAAVAADWESYRATFDGRTAQLEQRSARAEAAAEAAAAALSAAQDALSAAERDKKERNSAEAARLEALERERDLRQREVERLRSLLREKDAAHEKALAGARRHEARAALLQQRLSNCAAEAKLAGENEAQELRLSARRLEAALAEAREGARAEVEAARRERDRGAAEGDARMSRAQRRLDEECEIAQRLSQRNQELSDRLSQEATRRAGVEHELRTAGAEAKRLAAELEEAERRAAGLSAQLAESVGEQRGLAREEGRLKAQLSQARGQVLRLEREAQHRAQGARRAELAARAGEAF